MFERLKLLWYSTQLNKIPSSYHLYLCKYSSYYNQLNPQLKKVFRERVFLSSKFINFKPVKFDLITEEMQILITSALIQITFGLEKYVLRNFKTIMVSPNTYSYGQYEALLGHVDHKEKIIVMSWPSVQQGFIIPDDAFNVALHELAHALQSENFSRLLYNKFFDYITMQEWEVEAEKELYNLRNRKHNHLKQYGDQNLMELFAVCIETFFEQPQRFKVKLPRLYELMVDLLDQDPTLGLNPILKKM